MCRFHKNVEAIAQAGGMNPQERISERFCGKVEQLVEVPALPRQHRTLQSTVKQMEDVSVPQFVEECVEVGRLVPQERIPEKMCEQIELRSDVPKSSSQDRMLDTAELVPQTVYKKCSQFCCFRQERICEKICEPTELMIEVLQTWNPAEHIENGRCDTPSNLRKNIEVVKRVPPTTKRSTDL